MTIHMTSQACQTRHHGAAIRFTATDDLGHTATLTILPCENVSSLARFYLGIRLTALQGKSPLEISR